MPAESSVGGRHSHQGVQVDSNDKTYCLALLCCCWQKHIYLSWSWNTEQCSWGTDLQHNWWIFIRSARVMAEKLLSIGGDLTAKCSTESRVGERSLMAHGQNWSLSVNSAQCVMVGHQWVMADVWRRSSVTVETVQFCWFRFLQVESYFKRKKVFKLLFHNKKSPL